MGQRIFECVLSIGTWIRAEHYGQRPSAPHKPAGHMTAPDQCCSNVRKFLPRRRPHMTLSGHRSVASS